MWSIKVYLTLFETTLAVVIFVAVVVFVIVYIKYKVEVCFNLGPLVMLTMQWSPGAQIKSKAILLSVSTKPTPSQIFVMV